MRCERECERGTTGARCVRARMLWDRRGASWQLSPPRCVGPSAWGDTDRRSVGVITANLRLRRSRVHGGDNYVRASTRGVASFAGATATVDSTGGAARAGAGRLSYSAVELIIDLGSSVWYCGPLAKVVYGRIREYTNSTLLRTRQGTHHQRQWVQPAEQRREPHETEEMGVGWARAAVGGNVVYGVALCSCGSLFGVGLVGYY